MNKQVLNYTFDASQQEVTFTDGAPALEEISLITNVTDGIIIFQFNRPGLGGTLDGDVLTLDYDTTAMDDADALKINVNAEPETGLAKQETQTDGSQKTQIPAISIPKKSVEITASGDTTIHTPASGNKIRLFSFGYSASGTVDTGNIKVRWRFGAGSYKDQQFLTGNQGYAKSPGNGKFFYEGGIDEALIVNLDSAATIAMNIDYEEI